MRNLVARGDILVSMKWGRASSGEAMVVSASLTFQSDHQWHKFRNNEVYKAFNYNYKHEHEHEHEHEHDHSELEKESSTSTSTSASKVDVESSKLRIHVTGPNEQILSLNLNGSQDCALAEPSDEPGVGIALVIESFPCTVTLAGG